ncbi:hypothetical protein EOL70_20270 [Leucothrix sargassi]|nr:hypothetical protein EOL70_20270 [Leucothrix sargassi]
MNNNEVKPSFSLKYLLLTAITAAIVGGVGLGLSNLYESRPNQELTVANGYSLDVIGGASLPRDDFEVEYYLKGEERKKISSLFRKKVIMENSGNVGISELAITAVLKNDDAALIPQPKIESVPKNIVDAISISKDGNSTNKKHNWTISLINPGESISFDYTAFSEKDIDSISLEVIPRKKDLSIKYEELGLSKATSFGERILPSISLIILIVLSPLVVVFPFYLYQWGKRQDYRERYGSFIKFFNDHKPWDLFKPQDKSVNKQSKTDT